MEDRLIITNGQNGIGAIRQAGIEGDLMSWDDILHEGPVPFGPSLAEMSKVRANYLASRGWGDVEEIQERFDKRDQQLVGSPARYREVVLFVEHDLYDQLQLLQVLAWFEKNTTPAFMLTSVLPPTHIGYCSSEELRSAFNERLAITKDVLVQAGQCWSHFTAPDPSYLLDVQDVDHEVLIHVGPAFKRLIEEYPDAQTGLSRIETQILRLIRDGVKEPVALFKAYQKTEAAAFLGDWSFWMILHELTQGSEPLIEATNSKSYRIPPEIEDYSELMGCSFMLTSSGKDVLDGRTSQLALKNIDKWIGGVHLTSDNAWCWDKKRHEFLRFSNP